MSDLKLASFHLQSHIAEIDELWGQKNLLAINILGCPPVRQMRPELIDDRTRLDLLWNGSKLGLRTESGFLNIEEPDSAHPQIRAAMRLLLATPLPTPLASIRFRLSWDQKIGLWLDMPNLAIRDLLDEKSWLQELITKHDWQIEIGQKHKQVVLENGEAKLTESQPRCWLPSFDLQNDALPIHSLISLFSQPGPEANRAIIAAGLDLLDQFEVPMSTSWMEWGAGYGNLSAAYSTRLGEVGFSTEMDPAAATLLKTNAELYFPKIQTGTRSSAEPMSTMPPGSRAYELWLLDPPRSGFPDLLGQIPQILQRPRYVLMYHCHENGLRADTEILKSSGYHLKGWSSVDAFPGTAHHEVISLWDRKSGRPQ